MQRTSSVYWLAIAAVFCSMCAGCSTEPSSVAFGSSHPIGRWPAEPLTAEPAGSAGEAGGTATMAGSSTAGVGAQSAGVTAPRGSDAGDGGNGSANRGGSGGASGNGSAAGRGGSGVMAGASGGAGAGDMAGAAGSGGMAGAAGNGGASGGNDNEMAPWGLDVTTLVQHPGSKEGGADGSSYGPDNVGAIWIQDGAGNLVKTLQLWGYLRTYRLTKYKHLIGVSGALDKAQGPYNVKPAPAVPVDVKATASLRMPANHHHVIWDLKDRDANGVSGKYTLWVEVADSETQPSESYTLEFDTSARPQTLTPPDVTFYTDVKLQLR